VAAWNNLSPYQSTWTKILGGLSEEFKDSQIMEDLLEYLKSLNIPETWKVLFKQPNGLVLSDKKEESLANQEQDKILKNPNVNLVPQGNRENLLDFYFRFEERLDFFNVPAENRLGYFESTLNRKCREAFWGVLKDHQNPKPKLVQQVIQDLIIATNACSKRSLLIERDNLRQRYAENVYKFRWRFQKFITRYEYFFGKLSESEKSLLFLAKLYNSEKIEILVEGSSTGNLLD
jgi:hypothetical protein